MKKVNFKNFKVFLSVDKLQFAHFDIRKQFSDLLYQFGSGMSAHLLCHLVFESDGEIEISDEQSDYLIEISKKHCTPSIIDSLKQALL